MVDNSGLGENENSQIDIINSMVTINMLQKLKSARIVIVLTINQFYGRCFESIKLFITSIANYLFNFDDFRDSILFVYTKGLTYYQVS